MNLANTIHQCFRVGKGDCPTIEDAIPADREKLRRATLLRDPDTIHEYFAEYDLVAFNLAFSESVEHGAFWALDSLRRDLLANGTPCLDDLINRRIEILWLRAVDDHRYGEPADFDERRAMA